MDNMKLAFTTTFDSREISKWSGTPLHMVNGFLRQGISIERAGGLTRELPTYFKMKQLWKKIIYGQRESPRFNIIAAKSYSKQIAKKIKSLNINAIIAPQINPITYLDSEFPQILWTDALYAGLIDFYPSFKNHSSETIEQGNILVKECLSRCRLAIFSSEWAANSAIHTYGTHPDKVKIVPFGANLDCQHTINTIKNFIYKRSRHIIKLLFIGKYWDRKGGDIVFNVVNALHTAGHAVELNFVGCLPSRRTHIPTYIKCHGFISKSTPQITILKKLFEESHLLFVPSRAEAYGIVFCEANAYGIPCITSNVGGIPTIIKNNVNGMTFAPESSIDSYCEYIIQLMQNYSRYEELALSAFGEFQSRLNWDVATQKVKNYIQDIL